MEEDGPVASTSRALAAIKLDSKEEHRLEVLLSTIESCLCDWGLSTHRESGMLDRLRDSKDGCELLFGSKEPDLGADGLLDRYSLPARTQSTARTRSHDHSGRHPKGAQVTAFALAFGEPFPTHSRVARRANTVQMQVSESGFQLRRTATPDFDRLAQLHPADWDDMTLYLVAFLSPLSPLTSPADFK
jgi:hypothetical protein